MSPPLALLSQNPPVVPNLRSLRPRPIAGRSCSFALSRRGVSFLEQYGSSATSGSGRGSSLRARSLQQGDGEVFEAIISKDTLDAAEADMVENELQDKVKSGAIGGRSLLIKLAIALGIAVFGTLISISVKWSSPGSSLGFQISADDSSSAVMAASPVGFSFKAFGYKVLLPECAPGWIYFWLLMAAGCGLFISEEALNIWVGITLSRMLSLDGTWQSFAESFSRNTPFILSTVMWVYWGVCISDMIPFYLGKLFRQTGASDDICAKLGIGKEKVLNITRIVRKYGNLIGFVERFSLGVRNPTAFLAGASGISPEYFFAGVCCGGLITLPVQLGIGFLLRERPLFAVATVATAVGTWTIFPYAIAASTALFLFLRRRYST
ncbi:uncharacterized protein LOC115676006 [Syzygium oleosum]|uniref:uncharacterized protein LOC115676006 n=1 Tax=Syzygium oleosum TaxID=219896 RepID=UPI0011D2AD50|nr:uncharacterized protein LOC115676006 [Syzygium oleosum]